MKTAKSCLAAILLTVVGALFLRTFVIQAFRIPTGSMKDTLLVGDFLLVNKFIYGVRPPLHLKSSLWPETRLAAIRKPKRGEIIVFKYPLDPSIDYIKRCVGLPGDTLEIRNGRLYVNGEPEGEETLIDKRFDDEEQALYGYFRIQNKDQNYIIRRRLMNRRNEDLAKTAVPPHHYFMLGDNRDNSSDSRTWGVLPEELIVGKAMLIYFSYDYRRAGGSVLSGVRWGRILQPIR